MLNWFKCPFVKEYQVTKSAKKVGSFEAKTRLAELLREVERGGSYQILRRGKVVAELNPPAEPDPVIDWKQLVAAFRSIRKRAGKKMNVRELVEEGRRF